MKQLQNKIFALAFVVSAFFVSVPVVHAAGLLEENCSICPEYDLHCIQKSNASNITLQNSDSTSICLPGPAYKSCGAVNGDGKPEHTGDCTQEGWSCAVISSIINTKKFTAICEPPNIMVKPDSAPGCVNTSDCNLNEQCVEVSTVNLTGTNTLYGVRRCIAKSDLPGTVLDDAGVCGVNAACTNTQLCVKNSFDPQNYPNVCYDKSHIAISSICTDKNSLGKPCGGTSELSKICMQVADSTNPYQCVDATALPGGPNAPSSTTCITDKDCTSTGKPFCVLNPVTNKNQCFSQELIFTLMTSPDSGSCKTAGTKGCKDGEPNSTCATYATDPSILLCIKGDALGSGSATVLNQTAAERNFRVAPQLEINIPTVSFTQQLTASSTAGGNQFYIPYIASYINGVYKYGIGFGVLFAVLMLMISGFRYMTAFGNAKTVSNATASATNALLGLGLLFSVYTIIYVIDPGITQMKAITIMAPTQAVYIVPEEPDTGGAGAPEGGAPATIMPGTFSHFKQCDFASHLYLDKNGQQVMCSSGKPDNLCSSGCGPTSLAEVLVYNGLSVSPTDVADWAASIGAHNTCATGTNGPMLCQKLSTKYPSMTCKLLNGKDPNAAAQILRKNIPLVFSCHNCTGTTKSGGTATHSGHYMVFTGVNDTGTTFAVDDVGKRSDGQIVSINASEFTAGHIANMFEVTK